MNVQRYRVAIVAIVLGCSKEPSPPAASTAASRTVGAAPRTPASNTPAIADEDVAPAPPSSSTRTAGCGGGRRMTVHFYDVGQGLAALVDLPDGRHIVVDTGNSPRRPGCGGACASAEEHLLGKLASDLHGAAIDLLWITHQHADHIGGAPDVLSSFKVVTYVDNGRDARKSEVRRAHEAAGGHGTAVRVVDPRHANAPIAESADVKITAVVPPTWPPSCTRDANECSIALRIDFCMSSVFFAGDAEHEEETRLDAHGPVTLLQVAHHGSETSTTPGFLARTHPRYAVISAGRPGEGMNADYCHPRAIVVKRLTTLTGGPGSNTLKAFDGTRCANATPADWIDVPTSDRLWATERDGDVVLSTTGDGTFTRD